MNTAQPRTGKLNLIHPAAGELPEECLATVHVLVRWEDESWCAIALEMSLRGYGETITQAFENLKEAIFAQVTFTMEHGDWDQMFMLAERAYVDEYFDAAARDARIAVELVPETQAISKDAERVEDKIDVATFRNPQPVYEEA